MAFTLAELELEPSFSVSLNTFSLNKFQLDMFALKANLTAGLYVLGPIFKIDPIWAQSQQRTFRLWKSLRFKGIVNRVYERLVSWTKWQKIIQYTTGLKSQTIPCATVILEQTEATFDWEVLSGSSCLTPQHDRIPQSKWCPQFWWSALSKPLFSHPATDRPLSVTFHQTRDGGVIRTT